MCERERERERDGQLRSAVDRWSPFKTVNTHTTVPLACFDCVLLLYVDGARERPTGLARINVLQTVMSGTLACKDLLCDRKQHPRISFGASEMQPHFVARCTYNFHMLTPPLGCCVSGTWHIVGNIITITHTITTSHNQVSAHCCSAISLLSCQARWHYTCSLSWTRTHVWCALASRNGGTCACYPKLDNPGALSATFIISC